MRTALLVLAMVASVAHADPPARTFTWVARRGGLAPGRVPGSFWLTTDAVPGRFSSGEAMTTQPVRLPFEVELRWRRIGPEGGRSMHVAVAGAVVLVRTGEVGLYAFDEAALAASGWREVPALRAHDEQRLTVRQDATAVTVALDGVEVARFPLRATRAEVKVGVGMKGGNGFRSTIYVRSIVVRER